MEIAEPAVEETNIIALTSQHLSNGLALLVSTNLKLDRHERIGSLGQGLLVGAIVLDIFSTLAVDTVNPHAVALSSCRV